VNEALASIKASHRSTPGQSPMAPSAPAGGILQPHPEGNG
jgi:hypothetical protein